MKKLTFKLASALLTLALGSSFSSVLVAGDKVKVEFQRQGISASLEDHGDYYYHADGRKLKFYRKKDVYAVRKVGQPKGGIDTIQRFKNQFGERVLTVNNHRLGNLDVVRIDNRKNVGVFAKQVFEIKPEMLKALDTSTQSMMPVLTTQKGGADLLLMSKVTLELNGSIAETLALSKLSDKYDLKLIRKLKLSADVYSMAFANSNLESSMQFKQVRQIMNEPFVAWAEPQFYVKPIKEQFTPNDELIGDQWNLLNSGYRGSRCDADCDANNAWDIDNANGTGAVTGGGVNRTVIAIVDDGVQLNHPDLVNNIWVNAAESGGAPNVDDDLNGYIDDVNGYDFVTDQSATVCENGQSLSDGDPAPIDGVNGPLNVFGQDSNPSPRDTANCVLADVPLAEDNHGTAVAGIAAAQGNNNIGIAGVAYGAQILPIRAISDFDETPLTADDEAFCNIIAEAIEYAAQHADVINNSWSLPIVCSVLDTSLARVTSGTVTVGLGSKRDGMNGSGVGSPVVFASGNSASGWVKVTVPVTAGEHAYEWRLLRSALPDDFDTQEGGQDDDTVWLDDIVWPDNTNENFESGIADFTTQWELNRCDLECTENLGSEPVWDIETRPQFVREGTQSARIQAFIGANNSDCGNSYLHQIKDGPAGEISFWVWVSTDTQIGSDRFEFLIDGEEVLSYGDIPAFSFTFVDNAVAYPASSGNASASPTGVIAVGASKSGDLSGVSSASLMAEERASYSQYGPTLDLVAPSSDQHLGITTTDRTGADGYASNDYTSDFGGTSASAPVVSGVAAAMLAVNPALSAASVKSMLRDSADEIGLVDYDANGRNDFHGHGRVNMYGALMLAQGNSPLANVAGVCNAEVFDYQVGNDLLLSRYQPQATEFCPALGPAVPDESFCFPILTSNGRTAVVCL